MCDSYDLTAVENVAKSFGLSVPDFMKKVSIRVAKEYYVARHFRTTEVTIDLKNLENVELNKQFKHIFGTKKPF